MKIFLHNNSTANIAGFLRLAGVMIIDTTSAIPTQLSNGNTWNALERVDGIVLEISNPSDEVNYFIAQSIVLQKPILCLYPKPNPPREMIQYLRRPSVPKSVVTKSYTEAHLEKIVTAFLQRIRPSRHFDEVPNIKFTLRITTAIDDYLKWLMECKKVNKAEYIRGLIKKDALSNEDYKK